MSDLTSPVNSDQTVVAKAGEEKFSRFRVIECLGSGGMGDVHLAEDSTLRRKVAIKSIRRELCKDADVRKRIERECLLHAKIGSHPHIVTLFDRIEEGDRINLVMEFVEGETLHSLIERLSREGKRLSFKEGVTIAVQTLEALARIHAHDIVHRDIKPANIMITRDDSGDYCAKLMDFGIARAQDEDGMTALTREGTGGPGTPLYMAPEQIDPTTFGAISPATDVYAMGVMLYQIISGKPPFSGTITEIFNGHLNVKPRPLTAQADPSVPAAFAEIIDKALAKRPEKRYGSAKALREALLAVGAAPAHEADAVPPPMDPNRTLSARELAESTALGRGQTVLDAGGAGVRAKKRASGVPLALVLGGIVIACLAMVLVAGSVLYNRLGGKAQPADVVQSEAQAAEPAPTIDTSVAPPPTGARDPQPVLVPPAVAQDLPPVPLPAATAAPEPASHPTDTRVGPAPAYQPPRVDGSAEPQTSASSLFEQMRQQALQEAPQRAPEPAIHTPVATTPEPTPAVDGPATAAPEPAPAVAPKPKPKAPAKQQPKAEPKPEPPAAAPTTGGSGFSVVGKEVEHHKR